MCFDYGAKSFVFRRENGKFSEFQKFTEKDSGSISDDHQLILFSKKKTAYLYQLDGKEFKEKFSWSFDEYIQNVEISNDRKFLVVGTTGTKAYLYRFNGTSYPLFQIFEVTTK